MIQPYTRYAKFLKMVMRVSLSIFFMGIALNVFSQKLIFNKNTISEFISKRYPLFLTGKTKAYNTENKPGSDFTNVMPQINVDQNPDSEGNNTYSSVVMVYRGELMKADLKLRAAVYPISVYDDSIVICTLNPRQGSMYSNPDSYEKDDLVLISMSAYNKGEITELPYEMTPDYAKRFLYSIRNIAKIPDLGSLKCFLTEELNKYNWSNEFVRQDYFDLLQKTYSSLLPLRNDMLLPSYIKPFYVDIAVKLGDYSFDKSTFPINFGKVLKVSPGLNHFSHDIEISFNNRQISGNNLKLDYTLLNPTITKKDSYFENSLYANETDIFSNWEYDNHMLYIPSEKARSIVNMFEDNRVLFLRLFIEPVRIPLTNQMNICFQERSQLDKIPFVLVSYNIIR